MERTRGQRLRSQDIEDLLNNSEIEDFLPSDEDIGDPPFVLTSDILPTSSSEDEDVHNTLAEPSQRSYHGGRNSRGGRRSRGHGIRNSGTSSRSTQHDGTQASTSGSTYIWSNIRFPPKQLLLSQPSYLLIDREGFEINNYFQQYIDDELVNLIVEKSNQTAIRLHGRSLNLDLKECYLYIGLTLVMGSINYPNLRMYWESKWRVDVIAAHMSRNRFTQLRNALKLVYDDDVSEDMSKVDKLWKVRPLIEKMRKGCLADIKNKTMCVDEMIIPFTGTCGVKQYCPGKPNPEGLKAFVLANLDGLICDFHVYQGKTTYLQYDESRFGLGEKAVLTLAESLVPGHVLYFDRYFTSEKLIEELKSKGLGCTGTVMKNRIPLAARQNVTEDRVLKESGRGSVQVLVRSDQSIALTKWFDNKSVTLLSSVEADYQMDICRRWCKSEHRYVEVNRPRVIRNYNINMGGVDLADAEKILFL